MSRIGKNPILVPDDVIVTIEGNIIRVKGKKGELSREVHPSMGVELKDNKILVVPVKDDTESKKYHGLTRTLIANMVEGVSKGYKKSLSLVGVGYRAAKEGKGITLTLGYSHPISFSAIEGVSLDVEKLTTIHVSGASKEDVGETASRIRRLRPPEPYHGKGVRFVDEVIVTKAGKAAKK